MQQQRTGRALTRGAMVLVAAACAALAAVCADVSARADGWDTHGDRSVRALAGTNETHVPNILRARVSLVANQVKSAHETRRNTIGNLR